MFQECKAIETGIQGNDRQKLIKTVTPTVYLPMVLICFHHLKIFNIETYLEKKALSATLSLALLSIAILSSS